MDAREMKPSYPDVGLPSFRTYIQKQQRGLVGDDGTPLYAHPVDQWIVRTLNSLPVRTVLDKAIDAYLSTAMGQVLVTAISIDGKSFPDLFDVLSHCAKTLRIPLPHAVTLDTSELFNAFTLGTDEYSVIFITPGLTRYFTLQEASFVVGHECGHIAARHMQYHTAVSMLTDTIAHYLGPLGPLLAQGAGVPLLAWSRRSEITADRAGLLCCGDLATAERAFLRLVAGFADVDAVDVEDYLHRARNLEQYHSISGWQQLFMTHPLIPKRIEALRLFARSELYFDLTGKQPPAGSEVLARAELDRRVNDIVKP